MLDINMFILSLEVAADNFSPLAFPSSVIVGVYIVSTFLRLAKNSNIGQIVSLII